jgi:phospholipid/cholesterol/gamma-HCH transport system substrate-binding protein
VEREGHYVAVGAFILLVLALGGYWLAWLTADTRSYSRYAMYFEGSVMGLSNGSAVTYMGVNVGRVMDINLDPSFPGLVQVLVDIDQRTPILPSTEATLAMLGVTGLVIIELSQPEEAIAPATEFAIDQQGNRQIPVKESMISELARSLPDLSAQLSLVLSQLNQLLDEDNIKRVDKTLEHIEVLTKALAHSSDQIPAALTALHEVAADLKQTSEQVRSLAVQLGPQAKQLMGDALKTAAQLENMAQQLDTLVMRNAPKLDEFMTDGLGGLEQLISDSRDMVNAAQALVESLQQDPSRIIYREYQTGVELP